MGNHVRVRLDLVDEARRFEALDDLLARGETIEAVQRQGLVELGRCRHVFQELDVAVEVELVLRHRAR